MSIDKVGYRDGLRCFDIRPGEIFVGKGNIFIRIVFMSLNDLLPGHFASSFFIDPLITDSSEVSLIQQIEIHSPRGLGRI